MTAMTHKGELSKISDKGAADLAVPDPLDQLAGGWLMAYASFNTRDAYRRELKHWLAFLASHDTDPLEVRRAAVDTYREFLHERGASPATIARALAAVSSFYKYCEGEGAIARNPVASARRPKTGQSPTLGLTLPEVMRLLKAAEQSSARDYALVCLLASLGLRISEALSIDVEDLDYEQGCRVIRYVRKGGGRAVDPLNPRALAAVEALIGDRTSGPLFRTASGKRVDRHSAAKTVRRLARQGGIQKRVTPHSLRHSFVTNTLLLGADLQQVQRAVGHSDPRTTQAYDRATADLTQHPTFLLG